MKMCEEPKTKVTCKWCGATLSPTHTGPCPKCGKLGKKISLILTETLGLKDSIKWEKRREFFEENPKIKWLIIAITIGSPFLGLVLFGIVGVVIGLVLGGLSYLLGPYAVTKVREIERGSA